jgi:hypothetical protein
VQECINAGTLTGKATDTSSTPCYGNGIDITFTSLYGFNLGYNAIQAAGGFGFIDAGFTAQQQIRILQTGSNQWFTYTVQSNNFATYTDGPCAYVANACPSTTTTTTTAAINCTLDAVVNPTFPGGPVGLTVVQRCNSLHIPPWFEIINYTGGSGQYTLLTFNGIVLLSYETATALVNGTIIPTPLPNGWDLYRNNPPAWPVGEKFWIVFADFNNHDNRIVVPLVVGECPPQGPTNTIFMKFDIL